MTRIGPGPDNVGVTLDQRRLGEPRAGRGQQFDIEAMGGIGAGRMRQIERRIKDEAVVFIKPQTHRLRS